MNDFAERSVIGSLLMRKECIQSVYDDLRPEMFRDYWNMVQYLWGVEDSGKYW